MVKLLCTILGDLDVTILTQEHQKRESNNNDCFNRFSFSTRLATRPKKKADRITPARPVMDLSALSGGKRLLVGVRGVEAAVDLFVVLGILAEPLGHSGGGDDGFDTVMNKNLIHRSGIKIKADHRAFRHWCRRAVGSVHTH